MPAVDRITSVGERAQMFGGAQRRQRMMVPTVSPIARRLLLCQLGENLVPCRWRLQRPAANHVELPPRRRLCAEHPDADCRSVLSADCACVGGGGPPRNARQQAHQSSAEAPCVERSANDAHAARNMACTTTPVRKASGAQRRHAPPVAEPWLNARASLPPGASLIEPARTIVYGTPACK